MKTIEQKAYDLLEKLDLSPNCDSDGMIILLREALRDQHKDTRQLCADSIRKVPTYYLTNNDGTPTESETGHRMIGSCVHEVNSACVFCEAE